MSSLTNVKISKTTRNLNRTPKATTGKAEHQQAAGILPPLFTSIRRLLPQNVLAIDDLLIKDNQVTVKYRVLKPANNEIPSNNLPVAVDSVDILRLNDGRLLEHWDTVYQVRS